MLYVLSCSSILYHEMKQPLEALTAYVCAVHLDGEHRSAWANLAFLYDSVNQHKDALGCFLSRKRLGELTEEMDQWIKHYEQLFNTQKHFFENK